MNSAKDEIKQLVAGLPDHLLPEFLRILVEIAAKGAPDNRPDNPGQIKKTLSN